MILCCGEALVDFVPQPKAGTYQPCPGGSIYNVAVGLGRLETPVGFYCKISTDFFGDMLVNYLEENDVNTRFCPRSPDPTTLAFVSLPSKEQPEPQFSFYANGSADRSLTQDELVPHLPAEVSALHFGSISLLLEPGATAWEALMRRERGSRMISLDPNIRPNLIPDRVAYRKRFERWVACADLLKLSLADYRWIYGDAGFEKQLEVWFEQGIRLVILTTGDQGAQGYTKSGISVNVTTEAIQVADTVGAGDTFIAAVLSFLHRDGLLDKEKLEDMEIQQLQACLSFANCAAAINCSRVGADPPYLGELENYFR